MIIPPPIRNRVEPYSNHPSIELLDHDATLDELNHLAAALHAITRSISCHNAAVGTNLIP